MPRSSGIISFLCTPNQEAHVALYIRNQPSIGPSLAEVLGILGTLIREVW